MLNNRRASLTNKYGIAVDLSAEGEQAAEPALNSTHSDALLVLQHQLRHELRHQRPAA